jgi:hypothetical protein
MWFKSFIHRKFSQASTDSLHAALASLKARHAATVDTLSTQISSLTRRLQEEEATCERLRGVLDELGGDYMKESYGRRREIALRIKLIAREESLMESLRRWILRAQEALDKAQDVPAQESLTKMVHEAKNILISTGGPESQPSAESLARVIAAQIAADSLAEKLHAETAKRFELQRILAIGQYDQSDKHPTVSERRENSTQYESSSSSVAIQASTFQNDEMLRPSLLIIESPSIDPGTPAESLNGLTEQLCESSVHTDQGGHQDSELKTDLATSTGERSETEGRETESPVIAAAVTEALHSNPVELISTSATQELQIDEHASVIEEHLVNDVNRSENYFDNNATQTQARDAVVQPLPEIVVVQADMPQSLLPSSDDQIQAKDFYIDAITVPDIPSTESAIDYNLSPTIFQDNISQHINCPPLDLQPNHSLLSELAQVNHRYDDLQRNFHDCHHALDALKQSLPTSSNHQVPPDALKLALERLTDYIEDARVELEIRIGDESLLARGYETLLSIPGALASPDPKSPSSSEAAPLRSEVELQIEAFMSGTDPSVKKAQVSLTHKLSDVQHDIAVLKRAIHDPEDEGSSGPVQSEPADWPSPVFGPVPATAPVTGSRSGGWASWIRGSPSRPSSPAPTFGNVMTSPRPRHSSSLNMSGAGRTGKPYLVSSDAGNKDPLASLGLRVPMPSYVPLQAPAHPTATSRTVSTMYMLGLGARSASGSLFAPRVTLDSTTAESNGDGGVDDIE